MSNEHRTRVRTFAGPWFAFVSGAAGGASQETVAVGVVFCTGLQKLVFIQPGLVKMRAAVALCPVADLRPASGTYHSRARAKILSQNFIFLPSAESGTPVGARLIERLLLSS